MRKSDTTLEAIRQTHGLMQRPLVKLSVTSTSGFNLTTHAHSGRLMLLPEPDGA
jgi:hypothetical protein